MIEVYRTNEDNLRPTRGVDSCFACSTYGAPRLVSSFPAFPVLLCLSVCPVSSMFLLAVEHWRWRDFAFLERTERVVVFPQQCIDRTDDIASDAGHAAIFPCVGAVVSGNSQERQEFVVLCSPR